MVEQMTLLETSPTPRLGRVLGHLGIPTSSWYRPETDESSRKRPGPRAKPISEQVVQAVVTMATENPWYGYKRIAVMFYVLILLSLALLKPHTVQQIQEMFYTY